MTDLSFVIDPDAVHRRWVHEHTWHLDIVPHLIDALVEATLPRIPVSRGGSRFDKDQITGGGWVDSLAALDQFDVTTDGTVVQKGAVADARELWDWLIGYTSAVAEWIEPERPCPPLPGKVNPDPLTARGEALLIVGWLIDHADPISQVTELDTHRAEMFRLIRHLRGRYGVYDHPRRAKPAICRTCGERAVVIDWVDPGNGSPKPVMGGKCKTCGEVYRQDEGESDA